MCLRTVALQPRPPQTGFRTGKRNEHHETTNAAMGRRGRPVVRAVRFHHREQGHMHATGIRTRNQSQFFDSEYNA